MPIQIACPSCTRQLRVPEDLLGKSVRCPSCQSTFTAAGADGDASSEPPRKGDTAVRTKPPKSEPPPEHDDERADDEPRRSRRSFDRGDYAPARGGLILGLGIGSLAVAVVSLLANFCMCLHPILGIGPMVLAVIAVGIGILTLVLGGSDKASIRAGKMNPAGLGLTQGGWICGLIGLILGVLELLCGLILLILGAVGAAMWFSAQP
jgi:predicted Zn finger-like uncharacterized protein